MSDTPAIGIDLGTTNSAIALAEAGTGDLTILENGSGERTTPSVVSYDGVEARVGTPAVNQAVQYPGRTVFSVKRLMGSDEVVVFDNTLTNTTEELTPEEVSALILKKLKQDAEHHLEQSITNAVITVPAYFNDDQRQATKHAGEIAGLTVDRIINEPTAACLAFGLQGGEGETVLVYDLGGGTFDSSLVSVGGGVFEVVATNGETQLGGDDWDDTIVDWLIERIERELSIAFDAEANPIALERLFDAAQQAKHDLSARERTTISIPFLEIDGETHNVEYELARDEFEAMTDHLVETTIECCAELLEDAGYTPAAIDTVLLVGGATRMPQIQNYVEAFFNHPPSKRVNPDEAVALGAAAQAAIIHETALPVPADDRSGGQTPSLEKNQPNRTLETTSANTNDIVLADVTPQSLGVRTIDLETREYYYSVLINRNSPIPARATDRFSTLDDNQEYVRFPVYQGNSPTLDENEQIDEFKIGPIPPRPRGEPNIEVEFQLDENGILHASAEDIDHNIGTEIEIQPTMTLTQHEISKLRQTLPVLR
ncbi:Hsp70 family protein [Saliphagus infecundisoli]|uniref:Hsp70 family protein n=1 Tax=Saliphagus infecundisoli TaxID=1849069 RepID=A0ABD5QBB4_9EURY|nr:Hsp70 family protein [Saliphagus infecundisoli]